MCKICGFQNIKNDMKHTHTHNYMCVRDIGTCNPLDAALAEACSCQCKLAK